MTPAVTQRSPSGHPAVTREQGIRNYFFGTRFIFFGKTDPLTSICQAQTCHSLGHQKAPPNERAAPEGLAQVVGPLGPRAPGAEAWGDRARLAGPGLAGPKTKVDGWQMEGGEWRWFGEQFWCEDQPNQAIRANTLMTLMWILLFQSNPYCHIGITFF